MPFVYKFGYNLVMNEMYSMSIVAHNYSVMMLFLTIFINFWLISLDSTILKHKRILSLYNPIAYSAIGATIFTGIVMMAAKHLDFTIKNSAMIAVATIFIYLELKRLKKLKTLNSKNESGFLDYKNLSKKIFITQFLLVLLMAIWMRV